jgi:hypothetical protein
MSLRLFANRLRNFLPHRGLARKRPKRPTRLGIESLEDRTVPTVVFNPVFGQETRGDPGRTSGFPVLSSPKVYLIFWGTDWGTAQGTAQANTLRADAQAILGSSYLSGLKEYGSDGHALFQASWIDTHSEPPSGFKDTDVQAEIKHAIDDPTSPIFGPGSSSSITTSPIYVVITDPAHSAGNGGYNEPGSYNGHPINMILVGTSTGSMEWAFGLTFSHEMAERMSDPTGDTLGVTVKPPAGIPKNLDGGLSQIGDNEPEPGGQPHYYYRVNGQVVQPYWSFQYGAFIAPDGNAQSFNLSAIWTIDKAGNAHFSNSYDLYINGDQLANKNDNFVIDTTAAGGVQVTLNGEVATFDPGQIRSIHVYTGQGTNFVNVRSTLPGVNVFIDGGVNSNDTVTIGKNGSLAGIAGDVNVVNNSGHTSLVVNDSADTFARHGVITSNSVTGLSVGVINYTAAATATGNGVTSVFVDGGQAANTFNIQSTAAFAPVSFLGGINSNDTVTVGKSGSLAGIAGNVTVQSSGHANLVVDDSADPAFHTGVVTNGSVSGLSKGTINYTARTTATGTGVTGLTVNTGAGSDTILVQSTAAFAPVTIVGWGVGSTDRVVIGLNGSLAGIAGTVTVINDSGHTALVIDDSQDLVGRTANITSSSVTGLSAGAINYTARSSNAGAGVASLEIDGGKGANTFNVLSTAAFAPLTIFGGLGSNDVVRVGNAGSLTGIAGAVNVVNNSGHTALVVDDSADTVARTAKITSNSVTGLSAGTINYVAASTATGNGVKSVTIDGGKAANTFDVLSTAAFAPLSIFGGLGSKDTVVVGNAGSLTGIAGAVNVVNNSGKTALIVDDSADIFGRTGTITNNSVTGLSAGAINYTAAPTATSNGVTAVTIDGGHGANTFNVLSTAAFAPLSIVGGVASSDAVRIGNAGTLTGIVGDVNVSNPLGTTTLIVDDSADLAMHKNVVLTDHSVTGLSQGAINYGASAGHGVTNLNVYGAKGGNHFEVKSLPSTTNVNLFKGKPSDTVVLDGIFSNLHIF